MAAKKGRSRQRNRHRQAKKQEVRMMNTNDDNVTALLSRDVVQSAETVAQLIGNDVELQREAETLLQLAQTEPKKLDSKRLRKSMPGLAELLMKGTVEADELGDYIAQRHLLIGTMVGDEKSAAVTCSSNKFLATQVGYGLAKHLVGLEDNGKQEEKKEDDQPSPELSLVVGSVQSEVAQALLDYLDLTGFSIEESMSTNFCKTLVDLECKKWAHQLDEIVFYGEDGAFLRQSPLYQGSPEEIQSLMEELMANCKAHSKQVMFECRKIQPVVTMAAMAITNGIDQVNRDCWECGKVCKASLSACSCCKTANYCSAACQRKAWSSGHKLKCKTLANNFGLYQDSLEIMEATHSGKENQQLSLVEQRVDYRIFSHVFTSRAETFQKPMKGPSMKYFYQNMDRIQNDGWWIICIPISVDQYHEAVESWPKDQILPEEMNFLNLAHVLCYDLMGHYLPGCQMDRVGDPRLQQVSDTELVSMAITSDLGFGRRRRHPREAGVPMPVERFLELYKQMGVSTDIGKLWSQAKRQVKKQVLKDFRKVQHK